MNCLDLKRMRILRMMIEQYMSCCIRERDIWGRPSAMVLTRIAFHHRTPFVILERNLTARRYFSFLEQQPDSRIFKHDNGPSHSAGLTSDYLHAERLLVMPWPAFSSDFSPIEHLWNQLGWGICARENPPRTKLEFVNVLSEEWDWIPQTDKQTLIRNMDRKCQATVAAWGGHIRY